MKNSLLYEALKKLFKTVEIANEDVAATVVPTPDGSGAWTIPPDADHGEQYRVNCPFCHDKKHHLYISYLSYARPVINGIVQQTGHLRAQCFRKNCMKDRENYNFLEGRIGMAMACVGSGTKTDIEIDCGPEHASAVEDRFNVSHEVSIDAFRTWIPDWQSIDGNTDPVIIDYLMSRNVSCDDVDWLHIGWGPIKSPRTGNYINDGHPWVLFPVINNGALQGVQARCPTAYLREGGIKYYFHPGCRKKTVLFNMDEARKLGIGVICEGVFDVLSVGKPGVCCFGHTPSLHQQRLLGTFEKGLIWLPDTDVREDLNAISIAKDMAGQWNAEHKFPLGVHVVQLPCKDAGEMSRQDVWKQILLQVQGPMRDYVWKEVISKL